MLGHAIAGVEGVYDRHPYDAEKADALNKLAHLIQTIVKLETIIKPIREDRMKDEPPIGADENGIPIMYATLEEAKAASAARKITIIKASGSEGPVT